MLEPLLGVDPRPDRRVSVGELLVATFLRGGLPLTRGGRVRHLDLTIVCERPKIGPHRDAIRARIAEICGVAVDRVSVKATTTERLGFTGRQEGVAAQAAATLALPAGDPDAE